MSKFDNGVRWYTTGTYTMKFEFPEGEVKCRWCQMCRMDNGIRHRCQLTDRILYSTEIIHPNCPITFENAEENET